MLFSLLGALGCLVGWVFGELFLWGTLPDHKEAVASLASKPILPAFANQSTTFTAPAPPPVLPPALSFSRLPAPPAPPALSDNKTKEPVAPAPPPPILTGSSSKPPVPPPAEFADRLKQAGAKSGDVQITLIWFNYNDLDLHCVDPNGEHIFYGHRKSVSGGELDVDMNVSPTTNKPVENIYWPKGKAPTGKYQVYVHHYRRHGTDPTLYKVSVLVGGERREVTGQISFGQPKRLVGVFESKPAKPELQVAVSPELILNPGGKNQLQVRLNHINVPGPVTVVLEGDLRGLTPQALTIPENETEATMEIAADSSAPLGERILSIKASAGSMKAEAKCRLTVKEIDPELRLAVSPELVIYPGEKNKLKVSISRTNFKGPVHLHFAGPMQGLSPREFTIAAGETETTVEIAAEVSAAIGIRDLNVTASAGTLKANSNVKLMVKAIPPELQLAVSPSLVISPGGSNRLQIRIARCNLAVPVKIHLGGNLRGILPGGVDLSPTENETTLEIRTESDVFPGERTLTVHASAGTIQTSAAFQLKIVEVPPQLRLAAPGEIQISSNGQNELPVRILRERFQGAVLVKLEGDLSGVSPKEFTIPADQSEYEVKLHTVNASAGKRLLKVSATGGGVQAEETLNLVVVELATSTTSPWSWWMVFVIGFWTTLLTLALSISLVIGQNLYLARPWLSPVDALILTVGSLAAGSVAGGVGQSLYAVFNQVRIVPEIGFLAGWLLLGGLLGRGVVFFIPNLSPWRATTAGSCGGFLGGVAFIGVSLFGDLAGRLTGAAILGCAIGLMVAFVETAFRKVWLEVVYSSGEIRAVNLGATPVFIGGNASKCTVLVAGAPGRALKFWEQNGQIYCLDIVAEKTFAVSPGYRHQLKQAQVVVCSNDRKARIRSSPPAHEESHIPTPVPIPVPQSEIPVNQLKIGIQSRTAQLSKPTPSDNALKPPSDPIFHGSSPLPQPPVSQNPSSPNKGVCPVCGDLCQGLLGKRCCSNCSTVF